MRSYAPEKRTFRFSHQWYIEYHWSRLWTRLHSVIPILFLWFWLVQVRDDHKFNKIKNILAYYPEIRFVLLGDDSQKDPDIYQRIVEEYPTQIKAIYIRQTGHQPKSNVGKLLHDIGHRDIPTCYYKLSSKAIQHSRDIGLI